MEHNASAHPRMQDRPLSFMGCDRLGAVTCRAHVSANVLPFTRFDSTWAAMGTGGFV